MNFQKFSLREPLGGNPPDPHLKKHTTPLFSMHLGISREWTPPDQNAPATATGKYGTSVYRTTTIYYYVGG